LASLQLIPTTVLEQRIIPAAANGHTQNTTGGGTTLPLTIRQVKQNFYDGAN
jgi:hypothetical protein